jgi:3-oxoacyl-[acyl-carrier protein] reductase
MTLNFVRVRQLTHAVLPGMIERKWGRVINISGKSEPSDLVAANPAKAAIHAWSKGLSRRVGRHGITVNCIPPGRIMSEQIRANTRSIARSPPRNPVAVTVSPKNSRPAVFLPARVYITGAVLPVDGGSGATPSESGSA